MSEVSIVLLFEVLAAIFLFIAQAGYRDNESRETTFFLMWIVLGLDLVGRTMMIWGAALSGNLLWDISSFYAGPIITLVWMAIMRKWPVQYRFDDLVSFGSVGYSVIWTIQTGFMFWVTYRVLIINYLLTAPQ